VKRLPKQTLEHQLCEILAGYCGERGETEGAVETLLRIISERDAFIDKVVREVIRRK